MIGPLFIFSALIFFAGCSRDYAPDGKASGEDIYRAILHGMPQALS